MKSSKLYRYKSEKRLRNALRRLWRVLRYKNVEGIINHERAHFDKAIELGYSPTYALSIHKRTLFGRLLTYEIEANTLVWNSRSVDPRRFYGDMIQVALAPSDPSRIDKKQINRANRLLSAIK